MNMPINLEIETETATEPNRSLRAILTWMHAITHMNPRRFVLGLIAFFSTVLVSNSQTREYFYFCEGDGVVIHAYLGNDETVDVPEFIDAKPVVKIRESAFSFSRQVVHVNLPDSVGEIGDLAFNGCELLVSVRLPANLTRIGANAFKRCFALESLELPAGVVDIPEEMFRE